MRTLLLLTLAVLVIAQSRNDRPRARDLGIEPGVFKPGPLNAITDVQGVRVGQVTLIEGDNVRTGVTAILPHGGNVFQDKVAGATFVGNAFGKLAGSTQVRELGTIETPIVLTNTLSVGTAMEAVVAWTLARKGNEKIQSVNAVVGETNDGELNDIRGMHVKREHVIAAIDKAAEGPVEEGSVGAGTGTMCFSWKGGIGTSSRVLPKQFGGYTLGVLVQTNYGGVLTMGGAPVGKELGEYAYKSAASVGPKADARLDTAGGPKGGVRPDAAGDGSCMIVVATDAPLDARDLGRLAARAVYGLARTGSSFSNGSGEFAIAFSTSQEMRVKHGEREARPRAILPTESVSPLFQAALEATEEAVYNSLLRATTVKSAQAIPIERVKEILKKYGVAH